MTTTTTPPSTSEPTSEATSKDTGEARMARLFGLTGDHWMRHANPASVWSRFSCVSLIALAIWSRTWIGWYWLIPLALANVWIMVNPLVFSEPRSTKNWASKGVLGERIWADRNRVALPEQFRSPVPNLANLYSVPGVAFLGYGLVTFNLLAVIAGLLIVHGGKLWFLDRMVLLYEDMKQRNPEYASWER